MYTYIHFCCFTFLLLKNEYFQLIKLFEGTTNKMCIIIYSKLCLEIPVVTVCAGTSFIFLGGGLEKKNMSALNLFFFTKHFKCMFCFLLLYIWPIILVDIRWCLIPNQPFSQWLMETINYVFICYAMRHCLIIL